MNLKNTILCTLASATLLIIGGCEKEGPGSASEFGIRLVADSELCEVEIPETAKADETVSVTVNVKKENHHISSVTVNGVKSTKVSGNEDGTQGVFSFTMPAKDVVVAAIVVENQPNAYPISYTADPDYFNVDVVELGPAGEKVEVMVTMTDITRKMASVTFNGEECELESVSEADSRYIFSFTMPEAPVVLGFTVEKDMHIITPKNDEHSYITMYNCSSDWDAPEEERVYDEIYGLLVKFMWGGDLGYKAKLKVTSDSGINIDYYWTDEDADFGECWYFVMPDENVTISVEATEITDYIGKPFAGDYVGYRIKAGENNRLYTPAAPELTLKMNGNTSFFFKTTDDMAYDFDGCYYFNEDLNTFKYLPEYALDYYRKKDFGLSGTWFENGDVFLYTTDLQVPKPERSRYYFASLNPDFTFADAADGDYGYGGSGEHHLAEITRGGEKSWYFFSPSDYLALPVRLVFESGSSITEACRALVYGGDTPIYRYECYSSGYPRFVSKGKEAGTYTCAGAADLVLDGFGNASGLVSGAYKYDNGLVKVTVGENVYTYEVDSVSKKYVPVTAEEWTGSHKYSVSTTGYYKNVESPAVLTIDIDSKEKGKALVTLNLKTDWGDYKDVVSSLVSYSWDSAAGKIVFYGVLAGTADGRSSERINVTFNVAEDLKSLSWDNDFYLRATSGGNDSYLNLRGLVLE